MQMTPDKWFIVHAVNGFWCIARLLQVGVWLCFGGHVNVGVHNVNCFSVHRHSSSVIGLAYHWTPAEACVSLLDEKILLKAFLLVCSGLCVSFTEQGWKTCILCRFIAHLLLIYISAQNRKWCTDWLSESLVREADFIGRTNRPVWLQVTRSKTIFIVPFDWLNSCTTGLCLNKMGSCSQAVDYKSFDRYICRACSVYALTFLSHFYCTKFLVPLNRQTP